MATRNERSFVHLRVHSTYSLGVGLSSPTEICRHARRCGYDSVALTDIHATYGFVEFHRAALEVGIKPIYGTHIEIDMEQPGVVATGSLLILALDRTGLRNLCDVTSAAAESREAGEPFGYGGLVEHADGVVAAIGLWPAPDSLPESIAESLASLQSIYGDRLFAEVRAGVSGLRGIALARVAGEVGIPPVLTQDVRYVGPEKHQLIDLLATASDRGFEHSLHSESFGNVEGQGHGMKSALEMSALHEQVPDAFANASIIASLVQPDLLDSLGVTTEQGMEPSLVRKTEEGRRALRSRVSARLGERYDSVEERYSARQRLDAELERIEAHEGLVETLLQFGKITDSLRRAGIRLGPASGMRLQSLCGYLLGITGFDPYSHDDSFVPRFEPGSEIYGALDLQIPIDARSRVVTMLGEIFDERGVGYVPSVEHITAARAMRIVGERMGIKREVYDELLKIAVGQSGVSLRELVEDNRRFAAMSRHSPEIRELISHASAIEGLMYGFVRAKRTVIVSPHPLRDFLGSTVHPESGDRFVQGTRDGFPVGRIRRVDLNALTALSIVSEIETDGTGAEWTPVHDSFAYDLVTNGDLEGIYLLESPYTGRLARRFGIETFDDLVAFLALMRYRRGDMSFPTRVNAFRERQGPHAGRAYSRDVTIHTNGWLLFRDQLRTVVSQIVGCDGLEADNFVDRFRDHDPAALALLRREFMRRSVEQGTELAAATEWFERLLRLSGRVIWRQQVIAEALLVARMLYLKATQRVAFLAAVLNHTGDSGRREACLQILDREGRLLGPDVNASQLEFRVENGNVRPPLYVIKDVTTHTAQALATAKRGFGKYEDFRCFADDHAFVYKEIEALADAGAFASLGIESRSALPSTTSGDPSVERELIRPVTEGQLSFDLSAPVASEPSDQTLSSSLDDAGTATASTEKDGNKRGYYHVVSSIEEFYPHPSASPVELAGRIRDLHFFKTSSGKTVGFFVLFDNSGFVRVFLPGELVQPGEPLSEGNRVLVRGRIRVRGAKKVLDVLEIEQLEGGFANGETTPDESAGGNP